jgi:hypothetical protein
MAHKNSNIIFIYVLTESFIKYYTSLQSETGLFLTGFLLYYIDYMV